MTVEAEAEEDVVWTRLAGWVAGAHDTALQPITWAGKSLVSQVPSSLNSSTETLASEEAQARTAPASCGAHWTEFTFALLVLARSL